MDSEDTTLCDSIIVGCIGTLTATTLIPAKRIPTINGARFIFGLGTLSGLTYSIIPKEIRKYMIAGIGTFLLVGVINTGKKYFV